MNVEKRGERLGGMSGRRRGENYFNFVGPRSVDEMRFVTFF